MAYGFNNDKSKFQINKPIALSGAHTSSDGTVSYQYVIYEDGTFEYDRRTVESYSESNYARLDNSHYKLSGAVLMLPASVFRDKVVSDETVYFCTHWKGTNTDGTDPSDIPDSVYGFSPRYVVIDSGSAVPMINYSVCMNGYVPQGLQPIAHDFHITGQLADKE